MDDYDFNVKQFLPSIEDTEVICTIEPLSLNADQYCKGKTSLLAEINGVIQPTNVFPIKAKSSDFARYLRQLGFTINPANQI